MKSMLQLADVFENFRDICLENYKLDAAWYYTSTGLAGCYAEKNWCYFRTVD